MLIATTTMTFYNRPIIKALETIAETGFKAVEIWADHAWNELNGASPKAIKATLEQLGLRATVHGPIMDINITSPNRGIREESIRQNLSAIDFAKEIGAQLLVLHPGHLFSRREDASQHWELQVRAVAEILAYGKSQGILVAVENMDADKDIVSIKDHHALKRLFRSAQIENGLLTLDTTHLRTTENVLEFIAELGSAITHLHLSDATFEAMHLPLGEGSLDLKTIVKALKQTTYQGICSLECFIPNGNVELLKVQLEKAQRLWS